MPAQQDREAAVVVPCQYNQDLVKDIVLKISIVIPVLNESAQIKVHLSALQDLRNTGHEVLVVDGGSTDNTAELAVPYCDRLVRTRASRSLQMNKGASIASGDYLIFLHADTFLPQASELKSCFSRLKLGSWGRFDIKLSGNAWVFRIIESCMNIRSQITGIATGDQAIFVDRELFNNNNGFPPIALMEDIALSKILNKISKPVCLKLKVTSSSRRWEQNGIMRTVIKMWLFRLLYFFGYDVSKLAKQY